MRRRLTARDLQVFVAGALAFGGFIGLARSAAMLAAHRHPAVVAVLGLVTALPLAAGVGVLVGGYVAVRLAQLFLALVVIFSPLALLFRAHRELSDAIPVIGLAVLLLLLLLSTSRLFRNETPNQAMQRTAPRSD